MPPRRQRASSCARIGGRVDQLSGPPGLDDPHQHGVEFNPHSSAGLVLFGSRPSHSLDSEHARHRTHTDAGQWCAPDLSPQVAIDRYRHDSEMPQGTTAITGSTAPRRNRLACRRRASIRRAGDGATSSWRAESPPRDTRGRHQPFHSARSSEPQTTRSRPLSSDPTGRHMCARPRRGLCSIRRTTTRQS